MSRDPRTSTVVHFTGLYLYKLLIQICSQVHRELLVGDFLREKTKNEMRLNRFEGLFEGRALDTDRN